MEKLMRCFVLLMLCAVTVFPPSVLAATDDATSVIVNIRRSADEVSARVHQDLTARITEMINRWEANLQKALAG